MMQKMISFLCLVALLLAGCAAPASVSAPAQAGGADPWPTKGWQTSTPAEHGMDPALLEKLLAEIDSKPVGLDSVLVIRKGVIILEKYYGGQKADTLHELFSITKSFIATLMGIALDQGKLSGVDSKVSDVLPGRAYANPDPRKDAMTVDNLLTMSSGLDWMEGDAAYGAMWRSPDWVKFVMDEAMVAQPGKKFNYCSGCTHVLAAIIQEQVGTDVETYARKNLFEPLGITKASWDKNPQGQPIGGWGLKISARDMAKLGYLYLHKGAWDGKQVVSSTWVETATQKHIDNPSWRLDYGYQFWIARADGVYVMLGRGGQMVYVDPSRSLIVVFTAGDVSHDVELDLIEKYVVPAVR